MKSTQTRDHEVTFGAHEELISTTDTQGVITYANDIFCPNSSPISVFAQNDVASQETQIHVSKWVLTIGEKRCYDVTKPEYFLVVDVSQLQFTNLNSGFSVFN